ncbi:DeoR/GlpR family DNA-binding transcription regulator [Candidatus Poriferisocius sp.]|uniref:DeoR/GlpR family DNA-binding transcription regulator n=1 Tax=Candidatus Poriferisocius sp. TaxID=3101276 RepID=UPI003B5BC1FA
MNRTNDPPSPALFQTERQREIMGMTLQHGRVEVGELADRFGVTTETIRRDLSDLQHQRVVRRVHGGAIPWETAGFEPLLSVRADQHDAEKRRLAQAALNELPDSGAIIIDSGSTLTRFAEVLPRGCDLRVVTNSLLTAQALADHESVDVIVIGGKLRKNTLAMVDADAIGAVLPLTVDTLFISSDGLSAANGLTTPYREEAALKQAMIHAARRVVALVDHSKVGHDHFVRFADWTDVDVLITNREVDPEVVTSIESGGTTVLLA